MPLAVALLRSSLFAALLSIVCFASPVLAQGTAVRSVDKDPVLATDEQEALEREATEVQEAGPPPVQDLDGDLDKLGGYLDQVEKSTRRYFWSWLAVGTALTASQLYVATSWESDQQDVIRGSYWIGTALGSTSLILQLIAPKPALFGVSRYRKLPAGTTSEKQAKLEYGERILAGQAKADMRATSVTQHITGVVAALGSGLGVGLGWDNSLKQAITRSLGVFLVAELQIISRPRTSIQLVDAWTQHSVQLTFAPLLERDAQGLMLAGTF